MSRLDLVMVAMFCLGMGWFGGYKVGRAAQPPCPEITQVIECPEDTNCVWECPSVTSGCYLQCSDEADAELTPEPAPRSWDDTGPPPVEVVEEEYGA